MADPVPTAGAEAPTSITSLRPRQIKNAIRLMTTTSVALFIWGSPGVGKSEGAMQVATEQNKAFVDVRLSMYAPTDVLGMPYRVEENGETTGVAFTPPKILPRNLNESKVKPLQAVPTIVSFRSLNPKGSNGIYYVKAPVITATAINSPMTAAEDRITAEIVSQTPESFIVQLVDGEGNVVAGSVHYTITGEAEAIVAFEELNSAPLATQQAAYQFILDRRVGEYIVPDGVRLIAMGNKQTDKGLTYNQPPPLANRFTHVEQVVVFDDWQEWAIENLIHPHAIGFLTNNKGDLNNFSAQNSSRGFATPRSWTYVSKIIQTEETNPNLNIPAEDRASLLNALICGSIGEGIGVKFNGFRKIHDKLPPIDDIMTGKVKELTHEKGNIAIAYSLVTSTCYELRLRNLDLEARNISAADEGKERVEWYKAFNNVLEFWMNNFLPEVNVMGMRAILTIHKLPVKQRKHLPALAIFTERHSDLIR